MAEILTRYWGKIMCWVCLGEGKVKGPLYTEPCPNQHCPHRPKPKRVCVERKGSDDASGE